MNKYRLCFTKEGDVKFISHLDLIRLFTRAFTRAKLPLSYSTGFNPHPKMSIGLPLSVGVSSNCEYIDVDFDATVEESKIKDHLNAVMPIGIRILEVSGLSDKSLSLSNIMQAEYVVTVEGTELSEEQLNKFLAKEQIEIEKKSKRGVKNTDIKPDVLKITILEQNQDKVVLSMTLSAGSKANLKPDVVLSAMEKYIDDFQVEYFDVHRTKIADKDGNKFI